MGSVEKRRDFIINFAFLALILALVYVFFKLAFWIVAPFLLSFFFAMLLQRPLKWLDKKTKDKLHGFWSIVLVVLSICIVILPLVFILAALVNKVIDLVTYIAEQLKDISSFLATTENWILNTLSFLPEGVYESVRTTITEFFDKLQPDAGADAAASVNLLKSFDFNKIRSGLTTGVSGVYSVLKGVPSVLIGVVIGIVAWIFFTKDYKFVVGFIKNQLPKEKSNVLSDLKQVFYKTIVTMFKAYGIIMFITFIELLIGFGVMTVFGIMKNPYFALIAVAIAVFDILPVAGSGGVLIPWAVFSFVNGNFKQGIGLIVVYVLISAIRQYIEPKIVGTSLGVHPLVTLAGLYIGLKLFGFMGMFLVPLTVMTLKAFNDSGRIKLWKSSTEIRN